MLTEIHCVGRT